MDESALLRARGLSKAFGGTRALREVSLELLPGEVHAIVGENGAGKSTFAKILMGLIQPDDGSIEIRGESVSLSSVGAAQARGIAAIPQELILVPHLTVAENIVLADPPLRGGRAGSFLGSLDRTRAFDIAKTALANMDVDLDLTMKAQALGASQAQIVLIARALLADMQILILDEPTAALTPREADELKRRLKFLRQRGVGMIYISHRLDEVLDVADRVTVFRDGQCVATRSADTVTVEDIIDLMLARRLEQMYPRRDVPIGSPVLEVVDLDRHPDVRDVSLTVHAGEIVGVTGLIGAGKSELGRALVGADRPQGGTIKVAGSVLPLGNFPAAMENGLGFVPEERKSQGLVLGMSIHQNVCLSLVNSPKARARHGGLRDLVAMRPSKLKPVSTRLLQRFGVRMRSVDQPAWELSGGNQQKVVFAKAYGVDPAVMVLDEPTRGIDVGSKVEIFEAIEEMAAHGVGVLMLSSETQEVVEMCDRILVMRKGHIVAEFGRGEANEADVMAAAVAGRLP